MTSFINLMANDVWSEDDIINRTESMIASRFPKARIDILTRKVQGQAMGYTLTEQEVADLQEYQMVCYMTGTEADAARSDMALLTDVLAHEVLMRRLAQEPQPETIEQTIEQTTEETYTTEDGVEAVVMETVPNPLYEQDAAERADATIKVANASAEVVALYDLRKPVPEPVKVVEVLDEPAA